MKRLLSIVCIILALTIGLSVSVLAEPTDSFTHIDEVNGAQVTVPAREMFMSTKVINATILGINERLYGISDIYVDKNDDIYLLVSEKSKIIVLNSDYTLKKSIEIKSKNGDAYSLSGAKGVYVDDNGKLYVCNNKQGEIYVCDGDGIVNDTIVKPDSPMIPEDFMFFPYRILKDKKGYTYILSESCYYGALAYDPNGKFLGFYGANTVKASALDSLSFLWKKITQTAEKKKYSVKTLPSTFVDFCLDSEGYIVTCTDKVIDSKDGAAAPSGQIRKLSPGGADILYRRNVDGSSGTSQDYNFLEASAVSTNGSDRPQSVTAVDVDKDDFIYALDSVYGLVYVYDSECNMLGGFGGGNDGMNYKGLFNKSSSIAVHKGNIIVADYENSSITVFEPTKYGIALKKAQKAYLEGDYEHSEGLWKDVLSFDRGNQLAYRGLAMWALTAKKYDLALKYSNKGLDYTVYDLAWQKIISSWISDHFLYITIFVVLLIVAIIVLVKIGKKKNWVLLKNKKVKIALRTIAHPFDSFAEIKYKKFGSYIIASSILLLFFISKILESTVSGFLFLKSSPRTYNILYTALGTIGIVLLWSVCNWLVASLSGGNGTFKEVYVATNYSLIILVAYTFIRVLLSQFLPLTGLAIMDGIQVAVIIYTGFLLIVSLMAVHDYDFFKFLGTTIVSILFMILIVFVIFLIGVLCQQIGTFFSSLYTELFYR